MPLNKSKIVIFDMDETIGYFVEFGIFWDSLNNYMNSGLLENKKRLAQEEFNKILDLYPEFIRPNILTIFQYLKYKKISKQCQSVLIYTNNQGPKEWVQYIKNYFENKLKYKLFNHVISAFKINGKRVELCRSSHDKTMKDLIKCTKVSQNTEFCYLDDTYYPGMNYDNVYYIKVKPYIHDLQFDLMIHRFLQSNIAKEFIDKTKEAEFIQFMTNNMNNYTFIYSGKNKEEYEIDKIVTKKTMAHLQTFFNKNSNSPPSPPRHKKTLKNKIYKSKTLKNR
jgi:hypothetical protein